LTNASPAAGGTRLSLSHLKQLGVNALWLQPIHPRGIDGRQIDPATNRRFELGSPYAAKNYFAVMPLMASGFTPGASPAANDTPQGRVAALTEFENFVKAAKAQHITVFLDVPFNHTAHDTELAPPGQHYWGDAGTTDTSEIRAVEARIFSRSNEYDQRASGASNIAAAPDRYDFGKAAARLEDASSARHTGLVDQRQTWSDALRLGRKCRVARLRLRPLRSRQAARARVRAGFRTLGDRPGQYGRDARGMLTLSANGQWDRVGDSPAERRRQQARRRRRRSRIRRIRLRSRPEPQRTREAAPPVAAGRVQIQ
jgi:hypothetical protein